jgi:hypothetical protein
MAHHGGPHLPEDLVTHILERSGPLRGAYRVLSKVRVRVDVSGV